MENPNHIKRKVIVRIFLGIKDEAYTGYVEICMIIKLIICMLLSIVRDYDKELMLEMDRFVFSLSGDDKEVIERRSLDSAAAMKEQGLTLKRFMQDIIDNRETSTWCGFPQNLLVPRCNYFVT